MTLDQLIFNLDNIRREAGTGNLQVLYRDPNNGFLFDEFNPMLAEVENEDKRMFDAFDLSLNDYYVEI